MKYPSHLESTSTKKREEREDKNIKHLHGMHDTKLLPKGLLQMECSRPKMKNYKKIFWHIKLSEDQALE